MIGMPSLQPTESVVAVCKNDILAIMPTLDDTVNSLWEASIVGGGPPLPAIISALLGRMARLREWCSQIEMSRMRV